MIKEAPQKIVNGKVRKISIATSFDVFGLDAIRSITIATDGAAIAMAPQPSLRGMCIALAQPALKCI